MIRSGFCLSGLHPHCSISSITFITTIIAAAGLMAALSPAPADARQSLFHDPDTEFTQLSDVYEVKRQRWARPVNRYRYGPWRTTKTREGIMSTTSTRRRLFGTSEQLHASRRDRIEFRGDNHHRLRLTVNYWVEYHTIDSSVNIGYVTIEFGEYEVRKSIIDTRTEIRTDNPDDPVWTMTIHHPHIIVGDNRYEADVSADFRGTLESSDRSSGGGAGVGSGFRGNTGSEVGVGNDVGGGSDVGVGSDAGVGNGSGNRVGGGDGRVPGHVFDIVLVADYPLDDPDFRAVSRGFLFEMNGVPVAAVQVQPAAIRRVWLLKDLDEDTKAVLAAACTVLLNYHY
jgi:hypothetical protein